MFTWHERASEHVGVYESKFMAGIFGLAGWVD